jgi:regulator of replication initiation timing
MNSEFLEVIKVLYKMEAKLDSLSISNDVKKHNEDLQKRNTELVLENRKLKEENITLLDRLTELKGDSGCD